MGKFVLGVLGVLLGVAGFAFASTGAANPYVLWFRRLSENWGE